MQLSQNPKLGSINSNSINPNFIFCNTNYLSPHKLENLGFSATVFPSFKLRVSRSTNFSTRRRRFTPFAAAAAAAKRASGPDYYSVLNVSRNATLQEIKAAYRSLARKVSVYTLHCFLCMQLFNVLKCLRSIKAKVKFLKTLKYSIHNLDFICIIFLNKAHCKFVIMIGCVVLQF